MVLVVEGRSDGMLYINKSMVEYEGCHEVVGRVDMDIDDWLIEKPFELLNLSLFAV